MASTVVVQLLKNAATEDIEEMFLGYDYREGFARCLALEPDEGRDAVNLDEWFPLKVTQEGDLVAVTYRVMFLAKDLSFFQFVDREARGVRRGDVVTFETSC